VTLYCRGRTQNIQWMFTQEGTVTPVIIADNCTINVSYMNSYYLDKINQACDLEIDSLTLDMAGTYTCAERGARSIPSSAKLIVLATAPVCKSTADGHHHVEADTKIHFSCSVRYAGHSPPTMHWTDEFHKTVSTAAVKTNATHSVSSFVVKAEVPILRRYTCKTYFNEIRPANSLSTAKQADNAPHYKYSWTSEPVNIKRWHNCAEILKDNKRARSGIYKISVKGIWDPFKVYCDMKTAGGGWTVFQRRKDGSVNFNRNWNEFADGFGRVSGEHWLGNDRLAALTEDKPSRLRIDLKDWKGNRRYAEYGLFKIGNKKDKYRLDVLKHYKGTAGDSLSSNIGTQFATHDQDNADKSASKYIGAWWHVPSVKAFLNGKYRHSPKIGSWESSVGIIWPDWMGWHYSLKFTEMKIRPA